ncbi:MAG: ATP-binding cassette domain-containing protein, partial [Lactobacillaceae bacterium]|nr:ATP-binding cassette domain-containing protein [Lactobacillaceae bacterium]
MKKSKTWLSSLFVGNKKNLFLSGFLSFMITFSTLALMFVSGYLISRSAQRPENVLMVYVPVVLTRAFGISRPVFRYLQRLVSHNWVLRLVSKLRQKLFILVESNTDVISKNQTTAESFSLLNNDIDEIQNLYLRSIFPTMAGILVYIFVLIFIGAFNLQLLILWLIVVILIGIVFPVFMYGYMKPKIFDQKNRQQFYLDDSQELVDGFFEWQLSGNSEKIKHRTQQSFEKLGSIKDKNKQIGFRRDLIVNVAIIFVTAITVALIGNAAHAGSIDVNMVAAFGLAAMSINDLFLSVNTATSEAPYYSDSLQRLEKLQEKKDVRVLSENKDYDIEINDLIFSYPQSFPQLKDVNLSIPEGQKLAIIGRSGSGKTTLIKLITGDLKPQRGLITIGGESTLSVDEIASGKIGVLDQKPYLFNMSIAENLRLINPELTNQQITKYLKLAGLDQLIKNLPDGINTSVQ